MSALWKAVKTNVSSKSINFDESEFKINGQIILHQLKITENPLMKVLALTSPFNAVYDLSLQIKKTGQHLCFLLSVQQQISTTFFTVRRIQQ